MQFTFSLQNSQSKLITNANIILLMQAAENLEINWKIINPEDNKKDFKFLMEKNSQEHRFRVMNFGINQWKYKKIAINKFKTDQWLQANHLPSLKSLKIKSVEDYLQIADNVGFPQTLKPLDGTKGRRVYVGIPNKEMALKALQAGLRYYQNWLCQPYFQGEDYRFLLLNGVLVGIVKRTPPTITGNGQDNIYNLVLKENCRRQKVNNSLGFTQGYNFINKIVGFKKVAWYLEKQGLTWRSVLPEGKVIQTYAVANFQSGSSITALKPSDFHPTFFTLAQQIYKLMHLNFMGIDILIRDRQQPATITNCTVIEVNSEPSNRLHDIPTTGEPQGVSKKIVEYFFGKFPQPLF